MDMPRLEARGKELPRIGQDRCRDAKLFQSDRRFPVPVESRHIITNCIRCVSNMGSVYACVCMCVWLCLCGFVVVGVYMCV